MAERPPWVSWMEQGYDLGYSIGRGKALLEHGIPDDESFLRDPGYHAAVHILGRVLLDLINFVHGEATRG